MRKRLMIYCAGGAGREIGEIARRFNARQRLWEKIAFVDDVVGGQSEPILRFEDFLRKNGSSGDVEFLIGNGEPRYRRILKDKVLHHGYALATLIDASAWVASDAVIEPGVILYPRVCISPGTRICENTLIYYNCNVAHDGFVGRDCVMSMGCSVSGHCRIGDGCFLGANSAVKQNVAIGETTILGIGSVLLSNAESNGVYAGVPAKKIRENTSGLVFR